MQAPEVKAYHMWNVFRTSPALQNHKCCFQKASPQGIRNQIWETPRPWFHKPIPKFVIGYQYYYHPPSEGWGKVIVSVCSHFGGGGTWSSLGQGGFPGLRFLGRGGPRSQIFGGGVPGLRFLGGGGVPGLRFSGGGGGGSLSLSKGKNFWHQIWLDTCSDWKKKCFVEGPPSP